MSVARLIAWRYLRRPTDRLVSAVGIASLAGLIIGVMALVISMALMTGYRRDLERKLLGGNAELFVYSIQGGIGDLGTLLERVRDIPGVAEASPVLFQNALVSSETHATGEQVMLKGVEPGRERTSPFFGRVVGPAPDFKSAEGFAGVAIGKYLAVKLAVSPGDVITLTVPAEQNGTFMPNSATYTITNVYETGFFEFDARWVFMDLAEARQLLATDKVNLVEVKLADRTPLEGMAQRVRASTGDQYAVTDWRQMNNQLFQLLGIQQLVLFIVIGLIVFVSTFNIVSTLIMTVHEKRREIGILASMGADRRFIRRVFLWYGTMVGIAGTLGGILLGTIVSLVITRYELVSFGPEIAEVYFVSSIPFVTRWQDLTVIALFTVTVSFFATVLPSLRAARLSPVDALRHE